MLAGIKERKEKDGLIQLQIAKRAKTKEDGEETLWYEKTLNI
jgi:hypothetical protein